MNKKELFTIGTVVLLKEGKKRIMITGYFPIIDGEMKLYDYNGCLFPEGFISSELNILFNHDDIEKVFYEGPKEDVEAKEFTSKLDEYYSQIVEKINETSNNKEVVNTEDELPFLDI